MQKYILPGTSPSALLGLTHVHPAKTTLEWKPSDSWRAIFRVIVKSKIP